ncbi:hypothetical protein VCRA2133E348_210095 [Vibrio crassostreae]|nr:hypothetical protein VCRA2133E348_210095 [Vibrio crassostreae]CAK3217604.1 hypothetical protein VCRA213O314_190005 [Vibrio crassostreae]CAK3841749.1 hypothetical protein VCRA212O16_210100 [Vibrio crassostreae]
MNSNGISDIINNNLYHVIAGLDNWIPRWLTGDHVDYSEIALLQQLVRAL